MKRAHKRHQTNPTSKLLPLGEVRTSPPPLPMGEGRGESRCDMQRHTSDSLTRFSATLSRRERVWKHIFTLIAVGFLLGVTASTAHAQDNTRPKIVGFRAGFRDGEIDRYKLGCWTPIEVTVRGGTAAGTLTGEVWITMMDGDGVQYRVRSERPIQVLPGGESSAVLYAKFGQQFEDEVTVEFIVDRRVQARRILESFKGDDGVGLDPAIPASGELLLVLGGGTGVDDAARHMEIDNTGDEIAVARLPSRDALRQLPTKWYGYEGVKAVILATSDPTVFSELRPGDARVSALTEWVEMGGRLVLFAGSQAAEVLAPQGPLAHFAPGRLAEMATLRDTGALEEYGKSSDGRVERIRIRGGGGLPTPLLEDLEGVVEAREANLPLVIRSPRVFGQVVFVAADFDRTPMADWEGRPYAMARLLTGDPVAALNDNSQDANYTYYNMGYNDVSGQLRSALDEFDNVKIVSFGLVAGLVFVYILLIGPVDFLLVKKVLKRMEWTWFTFPLMVVVVSCGAYYLAYWMKGDEILVNQVNLVDVDVASGRARGTSWINVFSPRTASYDLTVRPMRTSGKPVAEANVLMSWFGLPGEGFGAMQSRSAGPRLFRRPYGFSPERDVIESVPIQVWSTKSIYGRTSYRANDLVRGDLTSRDDLARGSVTNELGVALQDAMLCYNRWSYDLGRIEPGATAQVLSGRQRDLEAVLKGRVHTENVDRGTRRGYYEQHTDAYDPRDDDVNEILYQMMFDRAKGGYAFSSLFNRYQGTIDLSQHLELNRAILVGRVEAPAAELHNNGELLVEQPKQWTYYRFILTVEPEKN